MEQRLLCAVVVSDISGYTALMGENEQKALHLLRRNRKMHHSLAAKHHGKIIEEVGDGTITSFFSVMNAIIFASNLIKKSGEAPGYNLHIGIHLSELIYSGKKAYGEGLNLASMIQSSAGPGEILISAPIYRNIHNFEGVQATFLGKTKFQAFEEIGIYRLDTHGTLAGEDILKAGTGRNDKENFSLRVFNKRNFVGIAVLIFTLILLIFFTIGNKNLKQFFRQREIDKTIAVLPFRNEGKAEDMQYFSDGVMESILNNLAKISALRVTSRTSTEKYRNTNLPARQIGRELEVNFLLEGSVQRFGTRVRIVIQLIDASGDKNIIWSESYNRQFKDLLNLQSEIANSIAERMNTMITPREKILIDKPPTANLNAYDLYVRGREFTNLYSNTKNENYLFQAQGFYNQAMKEDPSFALPYFGLGALYLYRYGLLTEKSLRKGFADSVMQLCNRAIELDPDLGEAYCLRGYYKYFMREYQQAIDDQVKALGLNPNLSLAYLNLGIIYEGAFNDKVNALRYFKKAELREKNGVYLGSILTNIGNIYLSVFDTAKAAYYYRKTLNVLPGNYWAYDGLSNIAVYMNNDPDAALAYADSTCTYYPDPFYCNDMRGRAYSFMKNFEKAEECYEKVREINKKNNWILMSSAYRHGYILWNLNRKTEAGRFFSDQVEFCKIKGRQYSSADFDLAGVYSFLGDKEMALTLFKGFVDKGLFGVGNTSLRVLNDPMFDNLRDSEEFKTLVKNCMGELSKKRNEIEIKEQKGLL